MATKRRPLRKMCRDADAETARNRVAGAGRCRPIRARRLVPLHRGFDGLAETNPPPLASTGCPRKRAEGATCRTFAPDNRPPQHRESREGSPWQRSPVKRYRVRAFFVADLPVPRCFSGRNFAGMARPACVERRRIRRARSRRGACLRGSLRSLNSARRPLRPLRGHLPHLLMQAGEDYSQPIRQILCAEALARYQQPPE
jgi:hypothetical protein